MQSEVSGTYGSRLTPCTILVYSYGCHRWYCVEGSCNVNCTHQDIEDGIDVEGIDDFDTMTSPDPITNTEQLEAFVSDDEEENEDDTESIAYLCESWTNGNTTWVKKQLASPGMVAAFIFEGMSEHGFSLADVGVLSRIL